MFKLSDAERERITKTVKEAESRTSGEIATAVIRQSNNYAIYELLLAILVGLIYGTIIFFFSEAIQSSLQRIFWDYHLYIFSGFFIFSTFLVILVVYFVANLPVIDRLIVPKQTQWDWVKRRAWQHFWESAVGKTKSSTGILIFISLLERRVELIADKGIAEKVEESRWQKIVDNIIRGIKSGKLVENLSESILECGELLARDFPRADDDQNELADEIFELDK